MQRGNHDATICRKQITQTRPRLPADDAVHFVRRGGGEDRHQGGQPRRVEVPVEMPEGMSYEGVFGEQKHYDNTSGWRRSEALSAAAGASLGRSPSQPSTREPNRRGQTGAATATIPQSVFNEHAPAPPPPHREGRTDRNCQTTTVRRSRRHSADCDEGAALAREQTPARRARGVGLLPQGNEHFGFLRECARGQDRPRDLADHRLNRHTRAAPSPWLRVDARSPRQENASRQSRARQTRSAGQARRCQFVSLERR